MSYVLCRARGVIPGQPMGKPAVHAPQMNHPLTCIALQHDGIIAVFLKADRTHLAIWTGPLVEAVNLDAVQSTVLIVDG